MNHLFIDIETTSGANLSSAGAYRYAEDEHFRVLLFGYAADNDPIRIVNLERGERVPGEIVEALADAAVTKVAYGAQFERICLSRFLELPGNTYLCPEHWRCTKVWASYRGLPNSMKKLAEVMGMSLAADPDVQRVLREKYIHDLRKGGNQVSDCREDMPVALQTLGQCIRQNLTAERALHEYLRKHPMPDIEWMNYCMAQRINDRGVKMDRKLVTSAINCDNFFRGGMIRRFKEITGLDSADSPAQFRQWLSANGIRVDSVSKEAVTRLRKTTPAEADEALRLWELLSRTQTRRYAEVNAALCADGRLRGLYQFGGHPLGRFSFPLIQLDNLPVCRSSEISELREMVRSGEYGCMDGLCDSVTDILTQLFVTSFIPRRKCRLLVVEYTALEQRILDWLVRDDWEARASSQNYVQDEQPRVSEYFHDDPRVTRLCLDIDNAVRRCLTHPAVTKTHGLLFFGYNGTLCIELPSGRALCYREPEIMFGVDGFSAILYAGMNRDGKWDIMQGNGARFLQDIVQGLVRDVLLDAMRRLAEANYHICMYLANKVVVESEEPAALMGISAVMEQPPRWAKDLKLTTQGYACNRYLQKKPRPSRR